ncbi:MAG: sigma-54 dependent transcriptional regulator [Pseudomonadota bacterium]
MSEVLERVMLVEPDLSNHGNRYGSRGNVALTFVGADQNALEAEVQERRPQVILFRVGARRTLNRQMLTDVSITAGIVPVIVAVPSGSVAEAVQAIRYGAADVIEYLPACGLNGADLIGLLEDWWGRRLEEARSVRTAAVDGSLQATCRLIGKTGVMRALISDIVAVAPRDTTLLITGESGTGKELVAREIHDRGPRSIGPFVAINCGAIPDQLFESELFGHEQGAFTGAHRRRTGCIELSHGGTLFLDEIGELSLSAQVKLLRFLQEREIVRVGGGKPLKVNTRVIAASHQNLSELVSKGRFRADLLYRINVVNLSLPPLRDRTEDIGLLIQNTLERMAPRYVGRRLKFTSEALDALSSYGWPGNVRELENVVESLLALMPDSLVKAQDLPERIVTGSHSQPVRITVEKMAPKVDFTGGRLFGEARREFEIELIVNALERSQYVQSKAAKLLGISRRILKYKMDKLGIVSGQGSAFTS